MYSDSDSRDDHGIVAVGNRPANVPRSRFLGEPADKSQIALYNTAVSLTHAFNNNWQVRARFNHLLRDVEDPQTSGNSLNELTGELQRSFFTGKDTGNTYQGTVDLTGQFNTAGIEHNVLAGGIFIEVPLMLTPFLQMPVQLTFLVLDTAMLIFQINLIISLLIKKYNGMVCIFRIKSLCSISCI